MTDFPYRSALIVGAGPGISASFARQLAAVGVEVALAARNVQKLESLVQGTRMHIYGADASDPESVARLFDQVCASIDGPEIVLYNAGARVQGPLAELDPVAVQRAMAVTAYGGFLVTQQAAKRML